jgi:hypothetical protein
MKICMKNSIYKVIKKQIMENEWMKQIIDDIVSFNMKYITNKVAYMLALCTSSYDWLIEKKPTKNEKWKKLKK